MTEAEIRSKIAAETLRVRVATLAHCQNIPADLKAIRQWAVYRFDPRKAKKDPGGYSSKMGKPPVSPKSGYPLKEWEKSENCLTFDQAVNALEDNTSGNLAGIGLIFTGREPFSGVDVDSCITPMALSNAALTKQAREIVDRLDTYTEISPSGTGLRLIGRGKLPGGDNGGKCGDYEAYSAARFLTMTGRVFEEKKPIRDFASDLAWFRKTYATAQKPEPSEPPPRERQETRQPSGPLSDDDILKIISKARNSSKIQSLMSSGGDSEGDAALIWELAFYTKDPAQIERLMRTTNRTREKWDDKRGNMNFLAYEIGRCLAKYKGGSYEPTSKPQAGSADTEDSEREPNPALTLEAASCIRFFENEPQPREFIVNDFLPRLNVGVIAAPGGTGKGYFTLQLALSVATGIKFLGKFDIANPGGVLYCNAEDDEPEIHRRFLGCLREVARDVGPEAAKEAIGALGERFYAPSLTGKRRLTLYPDQTGSNKRDLLNLAQSIPDLRLIILDPANRIMAGDFNRVEEVTAFIQCLEEIATESGATILLVTHTNKASQSGDRDSKHSAGAVLGSQSFVNAARWVMTLSTFDESMRRKHQFSGPLERFVSLRIPKANYLAPGLGELHLERVTDDEDETGLGSGPLRLVNLGKKEKEITPEEVAQWVSENPGLSRTAVVDAMKGKTGVARGKVRGALDAALAKGLLREDCTGKNKKVINPNFLTEESEENQGTFPGVAENENDDS